MFNFALLFICVSLFMTACHEGEPHFGLVQEGGEVVQGQKGRDNPEVISPLIIVDPLIECAESVTVKGFIPEAMIRIYADGTLISEKVGVDPESQTFLVSPPLVTGQGITATQEFGGVESSPSMAKIVISFIDAYPSGVLPKPEFPFLYLYDCGIATYVNKLPPGGQLRVFEKENTTALNNTIGSLNGVAEGQSIGVSPAFIKDHIVTAESQMCSVVSPLSIEQIVQEAPTSLPNPTADPIYEEATFVVVHGLVNGAKVTISRAGTDFAVFGAPAGHVRVNGVSVSAGDVLEFRQELCGVISGTTTVTVAPCSSLPPPQLIGPHAGDLFAILTNVVAGSRVQIYSGAQEIADGGGSLIAYTRSLVDGETLFVVQSLGGCTSASSYSVTVGTGLDDPSVAGPCGRVLEWEYGMSSDPELATADVTSFFNSPNSDVTIPMSDVPLHGVVRYPNGPGPFPLVLIVHGNHSPTDPSYRGYEYLLDLLASQCMIAVSIEEDFLNGWVSGEMDARGIVLLQHLQLWREWNRTPSHPFFTKVDMGSIGLSGHSRGGEAIVAAALFNETLNNPSDPPVGKTSRNYGFNIKSLYAIAPVDGQFDAGPITLTNADYYTMHGTHDGDVSNFAGLKMYNRAYPVNNSTNYTKGFVWVHGANHGQWNTDWGTCCESSVGPSALISATDQRQIGKTYMSAFFQSELKGWTPYRYFLNGEATFASLPSAVRVTQYQDAQRMFLNHYEEDDDESTGSQPGITNIPIGSLANYEDYRFNDPSGPHFLWGDTDGLIMGWNQEGNELQIEMKDVPVPDFTHLALHVGQTHESPSNLNTPGSNQNFSIQLEFSSGMGTEVQISDFGVLVYPLVTTAGTKSVQQTIRIPFNHLISKSGDRARDIRKIILRFNKKASGLLAVDEIQFTN
jgi:hypothetical protein